MIITRIVCTFMIAASMVFSAEAHAAYCDEHAEYDPETDLLCIYKVCFNEPASSDNGWSEGVKCFGPVPGVYLPATS